MKKTLLLGALAGVMIFSIGCGGPAEGQAYEKPDPKGGQAAGRLGTDEGAVQGIGGATQEQGNASPASEPIPPGG